MTANGDVRRRNTMQAIFEFLVKTRVMTADGVVSLLSHAPTKGIDGRGRRFPAYVSTFPHYASLFWLQTLVPSSSSFGLPSVCNTIIKSTVELTATVNHLVPEKG